MFNDSTSAGIGHQRDTLGVTDPAALAQLKRDLAVVVSAEALFTLTDLHGLGPEEAIASIVHTATTLTRAAAQATARVRRSSWRKQ